MENERLKYLFWQSQHYLKLSNPQDIKTQLVGNNWFVFVVDNNGDHIYLAREYDFKEMTSEDVLTE